MEWYVMLLLALAVIPAAFIWYINAGGIYTAIKSALESRKIGAESRSAEGLACRIDTDCPAGYVCVNGRCVPQQT
jgi:hypothetical protein